MADISSRPRYQGMKQHAQPTTCPRTSKVALLGGAALLLLAHPAFTQTTKIVGAATDVGVGANGSVYVIGTSPCNGNGCNIYERKTNSWQALPGTAIRVAVGPTGTPWVLNKSNELYQFSNGAFRKVTAWGSDVGVGADGSVFIIGTDGCNGSGCQVYKVENGQSIAYPGTAIKIAVDPSGNPWVVNRGGEIFRWIKDSGFQKLSGLATDVAVGADGVAYIIGTGPCNASGCTVYKREGENWKPLPATASSISVASQSNVWITNLNNEIFQIVTAEKLDRYAPKTSLRVNHTGKCLDLPDGDDRSGAQIVQNECAAQSKSQLWVERFVDGPWAMLVNGRSGMCIEVQDPGAVGSPLVQRPCIANLKQQWFHVRPEKEGDKNSIVARTTEFCVDVSGAALHNGAGLVQWNCHNGDNQRVSRLTTVLAPEPRATDAVSIIARDVLGIQEPEPEICWMDTTTRGVGTLADSCPANYPERDGALLCYEKCKPGYSNTTVFTCGQTCPAGWGNEPATCRKPGSYTVRGYALAIYEFWKSLDTLHREAKAWCEKQSGTACEWRHLLYYPKCKANFAPEAAAAMVCAPRCPAGMTDSGFGSCWKHSYVKASVPTICPPGKMRDAHDQLGLCYTPCPSGSKAIGPVCWQSCKGVYGTGCGAACAKSISACVFSVVDQVSSTAQAALNIGSLVATAGAATPLLQAGKIAAKAAGKRSLTAVQRQTMKNQIIDHLDKAKKLLKPSKTDIYISLGQEGADSTTQLAELMVKAYEDGEFDWQSLLPTAADLDPTGLLSVIKAFNKPVCK